MYTTRCSHTPHNRFLRSCCLNWTRTEAKAVDVAKMTHCFQVSDNQRTLALLLLIFRVLLVFDDLGQQIPMCFRSLLHKGISKLHPSHSIDGLFLPAPKVKAQLWRHQQQRWVFNFYFYWGTTIISRPCFQQQLIFSIVLLNGNVCWD